MVCYHEIVENQRKFYKSGATLPLAKRKEALNQLKKLISENKDALAEGVHKDLRRHPAYTQAMEIDSTLLDIELFLEKLDEWARPVPVDTTPSPVDKDAEAFLVKDPKGVVLLITPWNYPVAMNFWPMVAILGAGNTCVLKPSELSPHSSQVAEQLIAKYFNKEYVTVVQGAAPETTELLKERFDHIMYTGSPMVAKIIMAAAAKHLTPVTLELGGKCPVVVEADADLDTVAERVGAGKWVNVGQTCIAPDYVMTTPEVRPKLAQAFERFLKKTYGDDPKSHPLYSRVINERHFDRLSGVLGESKGNVALKHGGDPDRSDKYIPPHVVEVEQDDTLLKEEIFGPILPILSVPNFDAALSYINEHEHPLASYIFTKDEGKIHRFLETTTAGGVTVNDVMKHVGVRNLPFGGVGNSGMGRYGGKYGFDTFSHEKAVIKRKL